MVATTGIGGALQGLMGPQRDDRLQQQGALAQWAQQMYAPGASVPVDTPLGLAVGTTSDNTGTIAINNDWSGTAMRIGDVEVGGKIYQYKDNAVYEHTPYGQGIKISKGRRPKFFWRVNEKVKNVEGAEKNPLDELRIKVATWLQGGDPTYA
jgi:hypothetical protein